TSGKAGSLSGEASTPPSRRRAALPARQVCKLCGYDDDVSVQTLAPGAWEFRCTTCNYTWPSKTAVDDESAGAAGITAGLGVYDDLLRCLVPGEPFVEYGIIELRYSELRPKIYADLIERYGHTRQGPKHYTVSAFLGGALGRLHDRGDLMMDFAEATGY